MCEILLAAWPKPEPAPTVLDWAARLERFGLAGFGWGMAWRDGGLVCEHRFPGSLDEDVQGKQELSLVRSTHFLIHLRRPSQLSTIQLADTQPFSDRQRTWALAHNGWFEKADEMRDRFAGRLLGKADSEVGFQLFASLMREGASSKEALVETHRELGGSANLGFLPAAGDPLIYHGAPANPVWRFRLGEAEVATTGLHSNDGALFDLCFPEAVERRRVMPAEVIPVAIAHGVAAGAGPLPGPVPIRDPAGSGNATGSAQRR